jgi:DUF218 domain
MPGCTLRRPHIWPGSRACHARGALWFNVPSESNQRSGPVGEQARDDVNRIAAYLARRDIASLSPAVVPRADVLVLCGSAVLAAIELAATAFQDGLADRFLVSGGIGHSTPYLRQAVRENPRYGDVPTDTRSESAIIAEILCRHHAVPDAAILIEDESTNCGENAEFSVDLLKLAPLKLRSVLLLQDPTMQRRTHECFRTLPVRCRRRTRLELPALRPQRPRLRRPERA